MSHGGRDLACTILNSINFELKKWILISFNEYVSVGKMNLNQMGYLMGVSKDIGISSIRFVEIVSNPEY